MADWSLTSLQLKLIKIGARVVRHSRAITFQLADVELTGPIVRYACLAPTFRVTSMRVIGIRSEGEQERLDRSAHSAKNAGVSS